MDKLFGQLVFFTRVTMTRHDGVVVDKTTRLGAVNCEHSQCEARITQFRESNPHLHYIRGEFVFRDYF